MIADDMMTFIKSDIVIFGIGVLIFIIGTLWLVFRKIIWIIVPISSCFFCSHNDGYFRIVWLESYGHIVKLYCTNVNFNNGYEYSYEHKIFTSLRENFMENNIFELITLTTNKMFWPVLYTVLTTIIAFLSLIFSEIKPIIDFGWMMTLGLITSFIVTFTLLPSLISFWLQRKYFIKEI